MDTIQKISNISTYREINIEQSISIWIWIALAELLIIAWLIWKIKRGKRQNLDLTKISKSDLRKDTENIEMKDVVDSMHKSRELYKELSKLCHPDKFINTSLQSIAEEIFQEISRNKRNYKQLVALKLRAINELNLKF
jgi:hypothetical protein